MINWQDQLKAFRDSNPDLPQGPDDPSPAEVEKSEAASHPRVDVGIERKGRGGKTATLITGWTLPDDRLKEIARQLKQTLGVGGSARGGDILIQGDRRDDVVKLLTRLGYKARRI